MISGPWVLGGNFNEILNGSEKLGGAPRPGGQIDRFVLVVEECGLEGLKVKGPFMTWRKGRGEDAVFERLDHFLVTSSWLSQYPYTTEEHILASGSDPLPIVLRILEHCPNPSRRKRTFRFEKWWVRYEQCEEVIHEAWTGGNGTELGNVSDRIERCELFLSKWSKDSLKMLPRLIAQKKKELEIFYNEGAGEKSKRMTKCLVELAELERSEETYWRQHSKML